MLENSKLLEFNPKLGLLNGLFQDTRDRFRDSQVDHGLQQAIDAIYSSVDDTSLFSVEIEQRLHTDELRSALLPAPFNFLNSIDFRNVDHALDLNEDFGGTIAFLSKRVGSLDAIRVDPNIGRLSALRNANAENICLVSEDLEKLKWPLNHYDLIVVGAIERLGLERDQRISLISRLQESLSENGTLIVGSPNANSLSSWFDPHPNTSASDIPYQSLYDFDPSGSNLDALQADFVTAGFSHTARYATFSQDADFSNLFAETYLDETSSVLNHFYRLGAISNPEINEYALFRKLIQQKTKLLDNGSRLLFLASNSAGELSKRLNIDFAHYPGTGRQAHWRSETFKEAGTNKVTKRAQHPELHEASQSDHLAQNLGEHEYKVGKLLVADWLDAAANADENTFSELVTEYSSWLEALHEKLSEQEFQKIAYDMLPFNLIVPNSATKFVPNGVRDFELIDTEWQLNQSFDPSFVLFRALFWFAFENKPLLQNLSTETNLLTIGMFVSHWMPTAENANDLAEFVELEEQTQAVIDSRFAAGAVGNALSQSFSTVANSLPDESADAVCQIQWGNADGVMDESHAQFTKWSQENGNVDVILPQYSRNTPVLRIDPVATKGMFELSQLKILDSNNNELLGLNSAQACLNASTQVNIQVLSDGKSCVALTDDPHLLFNLDRIQGLENAHRCLLELLNLSGSDAQAAVDELSFKLDQQSVLLRSQKNRLNEYRSKLDFLGTRLEQARENRDDLSKIIIDMEVDKRRVDENHLEDKAKYTHFVNLRLTNLNDQLTHQVNHNRAMDHYMMQRTSTRLKRMLSRIVNRMLGKGAPAVAGDSDAEVQSAQANVAAPVNLAEQSNAVEKAAPEEEKELLGQNLEDYDLWVEQNDMTANEIIAAKQKIEGLTYKPVFSILVPIYNTDPDYLLPMIRSVQAQIYPHWQLCLVDDCSPRKWLRTILEIEAAKDDRIVLQFNDKNQGIALTSNDALALATGDYIALLDHDDELSIDALYENAKLINERPDAGLIYSDEDKMDMKGNRLEPFFKPDYSPDLLDTNNYVCHFTVMKKAIADRIGGFRKGFDGSQDHDIILRAIEESSYVAHIPKILYHWRKIPGSTAVEYDSKSYAWEAGRRAVEECAQRHDEFARVEYGSLKGTYRVYRDIRDEPLVSIVIPFKDKPELLLDCIGAILQHTSYENYEIVGVSNNSEQAETTAAMEQLQQQDSRVRFIEKNIPFNFSAICNYGVENSKGEYVLLLNNDVTVENKDWLERLLEHAQRPNVGAVGGKLLFPDGRIQHAGIVAGMVGAAGHPHKFFPDRHIGYHGRLHMVYNVSAVTGAMLMVRKDKYLEVGGLDEENLAVAYNDVDFCLKLLERGYRNLFTPHSRAIHHESVSRGYEDTDEKMARLLKEQSHFLERWKDFLAKGDPYYNPNLSLKNEYFSLKFIEERLEQDK